MRDYCDNTSNTIINGDVCREMNFINYPISIIHYHGQHVSRWPKVELISCG